MNELDSTSVKAVRSQAAAAETIVVKAGTNSLTDEDSRLDKKKIDRLVDDVMTVVNQGVDVLLVSSGAVGAGIGRVGYANESIEESQALSTVGQPHLMRQYTESFERFDRKTAQLLLTQQDLDQPDRFSNIHNTVSTLLSWDIIPIINENDAVATKEIRIGDNDMLSASVAIGLDVDLLVTLTDVGGVYTGNPKTDSTATRIEVIGDNYEDIEAIVAESGSERFGGIQTKVAGARDVSLQGIPAIIANSADGDVLEKIVNGKAVGSLFLPRDGGTDD